MARRFTCTEKWDDPFFSELKPEWKLAWLFIVDRCDHAGIFKPNIKAMILYCDLPLDTKAEQVLMMMQGRIVDLGESWFIPKFLKFQYPKGLSSKKPAIVSVCKILKEKGIFNDIHNYLGNDYITISESLPNDCIMISESLPNDCIMIKDKDKDKYKGKVKDEDEDTPRLRQNFNAHWNIKCTAAQWQRVHQILEAIPEHGFDRFNEIAEKIQIGLRNAGLSPCGTEKLAVKALEEFNQNPKSSEFDF